MEISGWIGREFLPMNSSSSFQSKSVFSFIWHTHHIQCSIIVYTFRIIPLTNSLSRLLFYGFTYLRNPSLKIIASVIAVIGFENLSCHSKLSIISKCECETTPSIFVWPMKNVRNCNCKITTKPWNLEKNLSGSYNCSQCLCRSWQTGWSCKKSRTTVKM